MIKAQAVEVLRSITYKPGWNFRFDENYTDPTGLTGVLIEAVWPAPLSEEEFAPLYKEQADLIRRTGVTDGFIRECASRTDLLRWFIDWIIAIEIHETREFFRIDHSEIGGGYPAPFHPHKLGGCVRWEMSGERIGSPFVMIEDPS